MDTQDEDINLIMPENSPEYLNEVLYESFFQKSKNYYLERLKNFLYFNDKISFSPYAFFFSYMWLAYRKMYLEIIVSMFVLGIVEVIISLFIDLSGADRIIGIIYATIFGFTGNYFYLLKAKRKVAYADSNYENIDDKINYLNKRGGVSYIAPILLIIILVLIYMIGDDLSSQYEYYE